MGVENIRRGLRRSWKDGTHRQMQLARELDTDTPKTLKLLEGMLISLRWVVGENKEKAE